jgi:hypothetical protein
MQVKSHTAPSALPEVPSGVVGSLEAPGGAVVSPWSTEGVCRMCSRSPEDVQDFGHERNCEFAVVER